MRLTRHGSVRQRQRGFSKLSLNIIKEYGKLEYAPGNAMKLSFGKREAEAAEAEFKRVLQILDKVKRSGMIILNGGIVTVYHNQ
jgi:hypothetical protein